MSLSLRPVLPKDEAFVYQLLYENFYEKLAAWAWDPAIRQPLLNMQIQGQRATYSAMYPHADHGIIVFDGDSVGRLLVDRGPEIHTLVDITIRKQNRGAGMGTVLVRSLCIEAEMMRKPLRLQVAADNRARNLYQRLGFRMLEDLQLNLVMERAPQGAPPL